MSVNVSVAFRPDVVLLTAASATGAGVSVMNGRYSWFVWGTWGGATAQLQWSPDGGTTWIDIDGASLTANGGFLNIPISSGKVRVTITGGTSPSLSSKFGGID